MAGSRVYQGSAQINYVQGQIISHYLISLAPITDFCLFVFGKVKTKHFCAGVFGGRVAEHIVVLCVQDSDQLHIH